MAISKTQRFSDRITSQLSHNVFQGGGSIYSLSWTVDSKIFGFDVPNRLSWRRDSSEDQRDEEIKDLRVIRLKDQKIRGSSS